MADAPFKKWLYRECCNAIMEVNKKYGDIEHFACKCGKKIMGQHLKYFDTKEAAEKAKAIKMGDAAVDLSSLK
jgi:hypothetical protein